MERVEELVKHALASIIEEEIDDPRLGFATVSRVKVSKDLRNAVVSVSFLDDGAEAVQASLAALVHAQGLIRRELAARVELRFIPDLKFVYDGSTAYASHIQTLLKEIEPEEGWGETPEPDPLKTDE